jgi:hypothetical protein
MALDMDSSPLEREGTPVRESVLAAKADVDGRYGTSPDTDSITSGAREEHAREIRNRNRAAATPRDRWQYEADSSAQRRDAIRRAGHESMLKAASGSAQPTKPHETLTTGAPASWDLNAKAAWHEIPEPVRLAIQRDHSSFKSGFENNVRPHLERYVELDRALAPAREIYQQHGLSDGQALSNYAQWVQALHNPQTRVPALHELARQYGVDLQAMGTAGYSQPNYSPQEAQAVEAHLGHFAQTHPHFEQVAYTMGVLLQTRGQDYTLPDGSFDLEAAYNQARRIQGIGGDNRSRRAANVSPRSRSPAGRYGPDMHDGSGKGVRADLLRSIADLRDRA